MKDEVTEYALGVKSGKIKVCSSEMLAIDRFLSDCEKSKDPSYPYVFDPTRAERFFDFCSICNFIEGYKSGQPVILDDWQRFDFGNILGWVRKDTGIRRFRKALEFNPRGCAKSTLTALLADYGLTADCWYPPFRSGRENWRWSDSPSIICMASDKEQTKFVRQRAFDFAAKSPKLLAQVILKKTYMESRKRGGELVAVSRDKCNKDGTAQDMLIVDEYGAFKDNSALITLEGGFGKKPQCLEIIITTAGDDSMTRPMYAEYKAAMSILKGEMKDERYFAMVRQKDESASLTDFRRYEEFTPILRSHDEYAKNLLEAIKCEYSDGFEKDLIGKRREFLIKRCNLWQQDSEEKYLNSSELEDLRDSFMGYSDFSNLVKGKRFVAGFDMSKKIDLTAMSLLWKLEDGRYAIFSKGYMPSNSVGEHENTDGVPYGSWIDHGFVKTIDGDVVDTYEVEKDLQAIEASFQGKMAEGVYDPAYCYQFAADMAAGHTPNGRQYTMIECRQTTTFLNEPTIKFQELLVSHKLVICRNECFEWCCENAYTECDKGGRRKISKRTKDSPLRIDLLASAIFSLTRICTLDEPSLLEQIKHGNLSF